MAATVGMGSASMRSSSAVTCVDRVGDRLLGFEVLELADVSADDEAVGLAGDEDKAAKSLGGRLGFGS